MIGPTSVHLVPCPFCGGTDLGYRGLPFSQRVCCWTEGCEARGPIRKSIEEAREAWNDWVYLPEPEIVIPPMQHVGTIKVRFVDGGPLKPRQIDVEDADYDWTPEKAATRRMLREYVRQLEGE